MDLLYLWYDSTLFLDVISSEMTFKPEIWACFVRIFAKNHHTLWLRSISVMKEKHATKRFKIPSILSLLRNSKNHLIGRNITLPLFTHPLITNLWDLECSPPSYWNGGWNSEIFWFTLLHTITRIFRRTVYEFGGISGMPSSLCLSIHIR